jgi:hypothetical protein
LVSFSDERPHHTGSKLLVDVISPHGGNLYKAEVLVDERVNPHDIDMKALSGTKRGHWAFGIYQYFVHHTHKGLTLAMNAFGNPNRPTQFVTGNGTRCWDLIKRA